MKIQMLRWHMVCVDCGKEFGLQPQKANRHERRNAHKTVYQAYVWESEHS